MIDVLTTGVARAVGQERLHPARATILGPVRVIPQEFPGITCRAIDLEPEPQADALQHILALPPEEPVLALRDGVFTILDFVANALSEPMDPSTLREEGVYLLTGGLGGLGLVLAEGLATKANARLVLTGRTPLPPREAWSNLAGRAPQGRPHQPAPPKAIQQIEEAGGQVLPLAADVADPEAMAQGHRGGRESLRPLERCSPSRRRARWRHHPAQNPPRWRNASWPPRSKAPESSRTS